MIGLAFFFIVPIGIWIPVGILCNENKISSRFA